MTQTRILRSHRPNGCYRRADTADVPAGVRWDIPAECQGQMVEVAYADSRPMADAADIGSMWRRVADRSDGSVEYQRRVGPAWVVAGK